MKKVVSLLFICNLSFSNSFSQETLQSVTDRGAQTSKPIFITGETSAPLNAPSLVLYYRPSTGTANIAGYDYQNSVPKPLVFQEAGGNVGIGTTSPLAKLHVYTNSDVYAALFGSDEFNLRLAGTAEGASGYSLLQSFANNAPGGRIVLQRDAGNVGIGTTSPAYKLDVNGYIRIPDTERLLGAKFRTNDYSTMVFESRAWSTVQGPNGKAFSFLTHNNAGNGGFEMMGIYYGENGKITLVPNGGNVGIGTSNPTQKLSVDGAVLAKKVKVSQPPSIDWPDYVFDSSYQLASLYQIEKFIQTNKHLPDVPSAAQVKKEGLDLGDNQAVLLKKIEEFTLYIIEQNKQLEMQKKINDAQGKDNAKLKTRLGAIEKMLADLKK